jgi:hypothetical protein
MRNPVAGDLLSGPLGRAVAAELVGVPQRALADAAGMDVGWVPYSSRRVRRHRLTQWPDRELADPVASHPGWDRVREVVSAAVASGLAVLQRGLASYDAGVLIRRVGEVVENFAFGSAGWQGLAPALAASRAELRPVAEALAGCPGAAWWQDPVVRTSQRWLGTPGAGPPLADRLDRGVLAAADEQARSSGWWSSPVHHDVLRTTRGDLPGIVAVPLACHDEHEYISGQVAVWSLAIGQQARIYEVRVPGDWADLAQRYPCRIDAGDRPDWGRWSGISPTGVITDWRAVSQEWDGVHVTVAGYLATAYQALQAGDGFAFLAGWNPDETLWVHDVVTSAMRMDDVTVPEQS